MRRRIAPDAGFSTLKVREMSRRFYKRRKALEKVRSVRDVRELERLAKEYASLDIAKEVAEQRRRLPFLKGASAMMLVAFVVASCASPSAPTPPSPREPQVLAPTPSPSAPSALPSLPPRDPPGPGPSPAPSGTCPAEVKRGAAFYRADWPGGSCVGSPACDDVNAAGGFPRGVHIIFDSTPKQKDCGNPECLMPHGCSVPATVWTISPVVPFHADPSDPFSMQATFDASGSYTVTAHGPEGAEAKVIVVKIQ